MTTIAVVNTKGGVGKTSTAVYLAVAAARQNVRPNLIDLDQQGSASAWHYEIVDSGVETVFDCEIGNVASLSRIDHSRLNIIDTPPGDPVAVDAAVRHADFIIVPVKPSLTDMPRVWATLRITGDKPTAVLLTQVDMRATLPKQVREILAADDVPLFSTPIVKREAFNQIHGMLPTNLHGYDDVLAELTAAL